MPKTVFTFGNNLPYIISNIFSRNKMKVITLGGGGCILEMKTTPPLGIHTHTFFKNDFSGIYECLISYL